MYGRIPLRSKPKMLKGVRGFNALKGHHFNNKWSIIVKQCVVLKL